MIPTIGRIVHYRLTAGDALEVERRRTTTQSISERIADGRWPLGSQAHVGVAVRAGEVFPMLIVSTRGTQPDSPVSGQVFLDGTDVLWVTGVQEGVGPGMFQWPSRT